jgi:hypothetical protein
MLTSVKAFSAWHTVPLLPLDPEGKAETDLIQIRNIEGLDPVKASVSTSLYGSVDGAAYAGSSVASRNIVLTLHPNPDWDEWTYEGLRKLLYAYFMPKKPVRLIFDSDNMSPVEISGIVEDNASSMFSKDPEFQVSIICPQPYFVSVNPIILTGQTGSPVFIDYNGNIETGFHVKVTSAVAPDPSFIVVQLGDPRNSYFGCDASVNMNKYYELNSIATRKFVQNVDIGGGAITNLLSKVQAGSQWPLLEPGQNEVIIYTNIGTQDWEVTYFERFGGL